MANEEQSVKVETIVSDQTFALEQTCTQPETPTRLERAKDLGHKVKISAQNLFHDDLDNGVETDEDELFEDAAFNPQKMLQANPDQGMSMRSKIRRSAKAVANTARNPRRAITNSLTRNTASKISRQPDDYSGDYDKALIEAHDALQHAQALPSSTSQHLRDGDDDTTDAQEVADCHRKIQRIDDKRESLRGAWILGRHVKRVKVVQPLAVVRPNQSQFMIQETPTEPPRVQWERYVGHMILWYTRSFTAHYIDDFEEPPFDLAELAAAIERLAVVSTPWQSFAMNTRNIYTWADPPRTIRFMLAFWVLWYIEHIPTFALFWIVFITIRNKLHPTDVQTIRDRIRRSDDETVKVQAWSELIRKHGKEDWIEPLLDSTGPLLQMQLGDVANFFEVLQNFYRWERPEKTIATLLFFVSALLLTMFTSTRFCVKLVWFGIGSMFFYSFPIATNYPKYRHIVNPLCWAFWDIPNNAELAITLLQEKTIIRDAEQLDRLDIEEEEISSSETDGEDCPDLSSSSTVDDIPAGITHTSSTKSSLAKLRDIQLHDTLTFRAVMLEKYTHSRLTLTRNGFWLYNRKYRQFYPYNTLLEMQKISLDTNADDNHSSGPRHTGLQIKKAVKRWTALQFIPTGLSFIFSEQHRRPGSKSGNDTMTETEHRDHEDRERQEMALIVSESDRDKIFSIILSWSNLKWQPLFSMDRQNKMGVGGGEGRGNRNLDDAIKKALM